MRLKDCGFSIETSISNKIDKSIVNLSLMITWKNVLCPNHINTPQVGAPLSNFMKSKFII